MCFHLPGVECLRGLDERRTRSNLNWRRTLSYSIVAQYETALLDMLPRLQGQRDHCKLIFYRDWAYVYTNDRAWLDQLSSLPYMRCVTKTQARVCLPNDVVLLKTPHHKLRTYFRESRLDRDQVLRLSRFVTTHSEVFRPSPGLVACLARDYSYLSRHHFLDHNDHKDLLLLQLALPGMIRATLPIQAK